MKIDLSNVVIRKIITNSLFYNLTFREYLGEICKTKDPNFINMHIKKNLKGSPKIRKGIDKEKGRIMAEIPIEKDHKYSQRAS